MQAKLQEKKNKTRAEQNIRKTVLGIFARIVRKVQLSEAGT
jgi:hypothetical protein